MTGPASRVALVTGAARRIGRAIASDLARQGWDIAVHYRSSAAQARELVREIETGGRRAVALAADLASEDDTTNLVREAADHLGPISLLINNAAIFAFDDPLSANSKAWQRHMAINLRAPLVLTQGLLAQLPEDPESPVAIGNANIINLIDQRVLNLTPNYTSYTVSKAGLWALTQHLALALAPRVRVNAIAPGIVMPHEGADSEGLDAIRRALPLPRTTSLEDICAGVRFVLESPSLTGQMITLDGGQHLGWLHPEHAAPERSD